jgi:hypothetical protein
MPLEVRRSVRIGRSRADVAAFMFDPRNDLLWTGGIVSSRPDQPGPLVTGATVERTARLLGRTFDYRYVVVRDEPDHLVDLEVDRPFPMLIRYELSDAADGTLVTIRASGSPGRFFGWATPLLAHQVRKSVAADLDRLRRCLES